MERDAPTLDAHQMRVVESRAPRLMVEAGPGSGKTETISARVARMLTSGEFAPAQVAVVTYTRAMAVDLRRRIDLRAPSAVACRACDGTGEIAGATCSACMGTGEMQVEGLRVGTLHSVAAELVRAELAELDSAGAQAVRATGWIRPECTSPQFALPDDVVDLEKVAKGLAGKVTAKALRAGLLLKGADLASKPPESELRRQLRIRDLLTYDDVLELLAVMCEALAQAGTPLGHRIPCLMVDERQDLTSAHWRIFDAWQPRSITAVGDSAQAIFGFLGGSDVAPKLAAMGFDTLSLATNYRSTRAIIGHNNTVRAALAADGACLGLAQEDHAGTPEGDAPWLRDVVQQSDDVVQCVKAASTGAWNEIAVLAPEWATLAAVRDALVGAGIPVDYPTALAERVWSTVAGRAFVGLCRASTARHFDQWTADLVARALGTSADVAKALYASTERGTSIARSMSDLTTLPECVALWERAPSASFGELLDLFANACPMRPDAVVRAASAWAADGVDVTPAAFLADLAGGLRASVAAEAPDGVALRTIHAAKGLEWPVVVLCDACEGGIPTRWQREIEDELEGGRMLYVALTRARDLLVVLSPSSLRDKPRQPTRWLNR